MAVFGFLRALLVASMRHQWPLWMFPWVVGAPMDGQVGMPTNGPVGFPTGPFLQSQGDRYPTVHFVVAPPQKVPWPPVTAATVACAIGWPSAGFFAGSSARIASAF